jgi:hypothetical protein
MSFFIQFYFIRNHILKLFSLNSSTTNSKKNVKTIRKAHIPFSVFFFLNSCCRWVGDHSKEGLAEFGYRLERKVEKYKNPTTCWGHARTFCLKYGNIGPFLFFLKAFIPFATTFSLSPVCNCPKKH